MTNKELSAKTRININEPIIPQVGRIMNDNTLTLEQKIEWWNEARSILFPLIEEESKEQKTLRRYE